MFFIGWLLAIVLPVVLFGILLKIDEKYVWIRKLYLFLGFLLPLGLFFFNVDDISLTLYMISYGVFCSCFTMYSIYRYGWLGKIQLYFLVICIFLQYLD